MGGGRKKMKMCFSEMSFLPLYPFFAAAVIEGKIGKADLEIEERKGGKKCEAATKSRRRVCPLVRSTVQGFPPLPPSMQKMGFELRLEWLVGSPTHE